MTFKIGRLEFNYFYHNYNTTHKNERCVEVPIALWFLDKHPNAIEIGAVTPYYRDAKHLVIDQFDKHPKATNVDALTLTKLDVPVLSISTIEHIANGEYAAHKHGAGFLLLSKIVSESPHYLVTFPTAGNHELDVALKGSGFPFKAMKRIGDKVWVQSEYDETVKYGQPFHAGNQIVIVSNVPEIMA